MAPIADPWNLDPTSPISNSSFNSVNVAEQMPPSLVNNALRQLASFLAQTTSYKSADISASVSTNICATGTGYYMDVTGANAINHFGSPAGAEQPAAAPFRFLQFDSSASVSHGANIKLIGSVSRRMQPGDVSGLIHEGSGVWREFCFARADGNLPMDSLSVTTITNRSMSTSAISTVTLNAASASVTNQVFTNLNATSISGSVVNARGSFNVNGIATVQTLQRLTQYSSAQQAAAANLIPSDNTTPLSTEGALAFSQTVTPRNASSIIRISGLLNIGTNTAAQEPAAVLFRDTTCLGVFGSDNASSTQLQQIRFDFEEAAGSTSARSYSVRYGAGAGNTALNRDDSNAANYGGNIMSSLVVEEYL